MLPEKNNPARTVWRLFLIILGAVLMAVNINTFVHAGGLIPGGFTGVTLLIQEICKRYWNFHIPFTLVLVILNAVPAAVCFKYIGKKFTLYSCLMVVVSGLLTDWMPSMFIDFLRLHDTLLSAIFGGLLNAVAISLCLYAGATSGGTDFIAIFFSEKYRMDTWNYIFAGNCAVLTVTGFLFPLDKALYSIIFQFVTTFALSSLYRAYQQKTLLIITGKPEETYALIKGRTNHAVTLINGTGMYNMEAVSILYSVVYANEVNELIIAIHKIDPNAFINVIKTEHINGKFFKRPKD